ncbi:MAG: DUF2784 domain-containing protein [Gammaproteobacteria bacterium]|nr:DUF2784 domain-containing protein [Gammaproteobacteria bacterium]
MIFKALADIVVVVHLGFVAFAVLGGLTVLRWPRMLWLHLPALAWATAIETFGWICPLTHVENALRISSGEAAYAEGFVDRYLIPILYPEALPVLRWPLVAALLAINVAAYWFVWRRRGR